MISTIRRYARTVISLTAEQVVFQVLRRIQRNPRIRIPSASFSGSRTQEALHDALLVAGPARDPVSEPEVINTVLAGSWDILGRVVDVLAIDDWSERLGHPLESFHLQYHESLSYLAWYLLRTRDPRAATAVSSVVSAWIRTATSSRGDAWHPYTISVRSMHWLEVLLLVGRYLPASTVDAMAVSLSCQFDVLHRRRERHIQANHLQRNDVALALGGLAFDGADAQRWRQTGLTGVWRALAHDVLADGCHFERSPMYHALMLADVLRVVEWCDAVGVEVPTNARATIALMGRSLALLARPDGRLHQFNDAANGIASPMPWLLKRTATVCGLDGAELLPSRGAWVLPVAGYAGWRDDGVGTRVVMDAGPPGPREQPGHAHCDALSIEADFGGRSVLVDTGVHGYEGDLFRSYVRSTAAHNTVQVGHREQHEMWATFRVARFGRVEGPQILSQDPWTARGVVMGYDGGRHERHVTLRGSRVLVVTDKARGTDGDRARARWLLHPDFEPTMDGGTIIAKTKNGCALRVQIEGATAVTIVRGGSPGSETIGWHFPSFGLALPAACIEAEFPANDTVLRTTFSWVS